MVDFPIEEGKQYVLRGGHITKNVYKECGWFKDGSFKWYGDGRYLSTKESNYDIVALHVPEEVWSEIKEGYRYHTRGGNYITCNLVWHGAAGDKFWFDGVNAWDEGGNFIDFALNHSLDIIDFRPYIAPTKEVSKVKTDVIQPVEGGRYVMRNGKITNLLSWRSAPSQGDEFNGYWSEVGPEEWRSWTIDGHATTIKDSKHEHDLVAVYEEAPDLSALPVVEETPAFVKMTIVRGTYDYVTINPFDDVSNRVGVHIGYEASGNDIVLTPDQLDKAAKVLTDLATYLRSIA